MNPSSRGARISMSAQHDMLLNPIALILGLVPCAHEMSPASSAAGLTTEANLEAAERDKSIDALPTLLPGGLVRDTGGQTLYLTPGIQVRPAPTLTMSFSVQLPVYQNLNGTQLSSGPNLNLGVFTRIGG